MLQCYLISLEKKEFDRYGAPAATHKATPIVKPNKPVKKWSKPTTLGTEIVTLAPVTLVSNSAPPKPPAHSVTGDVAKMAKKWPPVGEATKTRATPIQPTRADAGAHKKHGDFEL